jgi:heavy metal translocating P-type ATPase
MARLADRYAVLFLVFSATLAVGAWLTTKDPVRALAVMVVATPCPLILAVPVAMVSGLSRAASAGVLIKSGRALETLAKIRTLVIDKTGTLTEGRARIVEIRPEGSFTEEELLRLGGSLEQATSHVIGQAIVAEARRRGLPLSVPAGVAETSGEGLVGVVDGRPVAIGGLRFVAERVPGPVMMRHDEKRAGAVSVALGLDGRFAGVLCLADQVRPGAGRVLAGLRGLGLQRIVLATGDRREVAETVGVSLSFDAIHSELTPDQKVGVVRGEKWRGPVMMIGDGINDAPALAAADLGVAMGANGAAASAEAADAVLLVDRLEPILFAMRVSFRSSRIALQSVYAGIGLSVVGMVAAALGYLTPVEGALFQEFIDVAAILNALRVLTGNVSTKGEAL